MNQTLLIGYAVLTTLAIAVLLWRQHRKTTALMQNYIYLHDIAFRLKTGSLVLARSTPKAAAPQQEATGGDRSGNQEYRRADSTSAPDSYEAARQQYLALWWEHAQKGWWPPAPELLAAMGVSSMASSGSQETNRRGRANQVHYNEHGYPDWPDTELRAEPRPYGIPHSKTGTNQPEPSVN